jgi:hypothetical protein
VHIEQRIAEVKAAVEAWNAQPEQARKLVKAAMEKQRV